MESLLVSVFRSYGIEEFFLKDAEDIEVIVLKRSKSLKMDQWIALESAIRYKFRKELIFLTKKEAVKLSGNLNNYTLIKGDMYE